MAKKNINNNNNNTKNTTKKDNKDTNIKQINNTSENITSNDSNSNTNKNSVSSKELDTSTLDTTTNVDTDNSDLNCTEATADTDNNNPHITDFMGNSNEIFSTYKNKYENTISSAIILLFFGIFGIMSTIGMLTGYINLTLSTFQHIFLSTLYIIFLVYGVISYFKALEYKEQISTENTMEDTLNRYLENHVTKEFIDSIYDNSITDEENYVLCISKIQELFLDENPDFNEDFVEYHIDNFLNENF